MAMNILARRVLGWARLLCMETLMAPDSEMCKSARLSWKTRTVPLGIQTAGGWSVRVGENFKAGDFKKSLSLLSIGKLVEALFRTIVVLSHRGKRVGEG